MTRVEYGAVAIETNVAMSPRDLIRLRASARRLNETMERMARQFTRDFSHYLKTPRGEREMVDRIVEALQSKRSDARNP